MELTLNIIWLAISTAAFVTLARWCTRQPAGVASRQRQRIAGTAVLCLVALLFPIISITDDLRCDVVFAEASVKRRASDPNHQARTITAVALGIIARLEPFSVPRCADLALVKRSIGAHQHDIRSVAARAPPQGAS